MEFELIERIRRRAVARSDVTLGIGDDAALLRVPAGHELVVTTDTLNAGVHFPLDTAPADIGWKALAVNLSDLAAMGATPAWCTLSLSLPVADAPWLDAFVDGMALLAARHEVALVGGDTTRGPLSIGVTAFGFVPEGTALRRDGARIGDEVWITGTPGDAAGALAQWRAGLAMDPALRARLDRPSPRIAAGLALRALASACIDVSDGLLADLAHVARASAVAATLELARLPLSSALAKNFDPSARAALQLAGGDDYELCFTAPLARHADVRAALAAACCDAHPIGRIESGSGVRALDPRGNAWDGEGRGWDHFAQAMQ